MNPGITKTTRLRQLFYIAVVSVLLSSCWENPKPGQYDTIALEDLLIEQKLKNQEREFSFLDSISNMWGWEVEKLTGGVLVERFQHGEVAPVLDLEELQVSISLVNGNHCFSSDSLLIAKGYYDGALVFEELSAILNPGDSCRALVPSEMGFGIKGVPGVVPPGAMLLVKAKKLAR